MFRSERAGNCPRKTLAPERVRKDGRFLKVMVFCGVLSLFVRSVGAQTNVVTQHYDNARTGANTNETILTPSNVNTAGFGKLFSQLVDGYIYAQPLYLAGVTMGAGTSQAGTAHNVVFIATEHDSVYAFDADTNGGANWFPLWKVTLLDAAHGAASGATTVPSGDISSGDLVPEIGITGTPVIDPATNTIYLVGKTKESGTYLQRLHALDITTGAEKFGGPVILSASVPGNGTGSSSGVLNFDPKWELQRTGLLLLNGIVYFGFGAHGDNGPWHGWILAYNASTLQQTSAYCTTPNGSGSGVWMSGSGLAGDVIDPVGHPFGRMFIATGNGSFNATTPYTNSMNYGNDHIRLDLSNGVMTVQDSFTPQNWATLNLSDVDVASGGILLLPDQSAGGHTHLMVQIGKEGKIYLVDRDNMGGFNSTADNIVQEISGQTTGLWSMPAFWNNNIYIWGSRDNLKAFSFSNGTISTTPTSVSPQYSEFPGATPSISANGTSNGIVWVAQTDDFYGGGKTVLRAFDATNVATQLYQSGQNSARDAAGVAAKFAIPTVTNGKVYVGTATELDVYGLLGVQQQASPPSISPAGQSFTGALTITITDSTAGASIYYTLDGSTPTAASTLYTGPISVSGTETITAIASASGFLQSLPVSETYTLQTQTLMPVFSPPPGSYASSRNVTLSDATPNATIYFTTDGSTPLPGSGTTQLYSSAIAVNGTTTIKAIATSSSLSNSEVASATYTITVGGSGVDFSSGFSTASSLMTFNGSTTLNDTRLQLTNGGASQAGSAFVNTLVNIQSFTTDFTFQLTNPTPPSGDGITFTIQSAGTRALGPAGGGLGYGWNGSGIDRSVAVKFDLANNAGEGTNSTGIYTNAASPTIPAIDLTPSGIDLHSGDTMGVHMTYQGATLTMTITDGITNKTFTTSWTVDIPSIVGGNMAYLGFTGGTGGQTASQKIESWTFVSGGSPAAETPAFSLAGGTYLGTQTVSISDGTPGATIFYTVDGTTPATSAGGSTQQYSSTITVSATETIKAIAVASGYATSAMASATYTIESQVAAPTFSPGAGTYTAAQQVTIATATAGATIYYTTNGTTPTTSSTVYTGPITVSTSETVEAMAAESGYFNSNVSTAAYTITPPAATPVITPGTGTYTSAQTVTITDGTTGATIYYTVDGSQPTTTSTQYTASFTVSTTTTVKAIATATNFTTSATATSVITIRRRPK